MLKFSTNKVGKVDPYIHILSLMKEYQEELWSTGKILDLFLITQNAIKAELHTKGEVLL